MDVRLCMPDYGDYLSVRRLGRGFLLTGINALRIGNFFESIAGLNASLLISPSIGSLVNHQTTQYSDCIGSLQRNESDLLFAPLVVPVMAANITHTLVDGSTRMGIVSGYNQSVADRRTTGVMDMVSGFTSGSWLLTVMTLFAFGILLVISLTMPTFAWPVFGKVRIPPHSRKQQLTWIITMMKRKRVLQRTIRTIASVILKQYANTPMLPKKRSVRMIMFWFRVFIILVTFYLTFLIKTAMVIVDPPDTIESYQDILDHDQKPVWVAFTNDVDEFKQSPEGSASRKIYERAADFGLDSCLQASDLGQGRQIAKAVLKQEMVYLVQDHWGSSFVYTYCVYSRTQNVMTEASVLYRFDEESRIWLKGNIQNHLITGTAVSRMINHRMQKIFEADLHHAAAKKANYFGISEREIVKNFSTIDSCISNVVTFESPPLSPAVLSHYTISLVYPCMGFMILAAIVCVWEICTRTREANRVSVVLPKESPVKATSFSVTIVVTSVGADEVPQDEVPFKGVSTKGNSLITNHNYPHHDGVRKRCQREECVSPQSVLLRSKGCKSIAITR